MRCSTSRMQKFWYSTTKARAQSKWDRERLTVSFTIRFQSSKTGRDTRTEREQSCSLSNRRNGPWGFERATTTFENKLTISSNSLRKAAGLSASERSTSARTKRLSKISGYRFIFELAQRHA